MAAWGLNHDFQWGSLWDNNHRIIHELGIRLNQNNPKKCMKS
jgi:hypothetical protein